MTNWIDSIQHDVRHAWRAIRKMPVLATVVIVSLGVGIGVNTAVFSWVEAVLLRPLPGVVDPAGFYLVEPRAETGSYPGASWREYQDLHDRLPSLPDLLASRMVPLNVGESGRVERTFGLLVSGNYFSALGVQPALGRFIGPDEVARPGGDPVVVISHSFWQTRLGSVASPVGRTLRVNEQLLTVVGVAPERFQGTVLGLNFDLWVPATLAPALISGSRELDDRTQRGYSVMGRLAAHSTRDQAQSELSEAMLDLATAYPESNAKLEGEVLPFWQAPRGPQRMLARSLVVLQGIMLLLLLAVCGNTANLTLARASARQREFGMRLALGAGPWRIVGLLLAENVTLALLGAALGVAIATWATDALRAVPMLGAFPIRFQTRIDTMGLAFASFLGTSCGLIFGLAPAAQLARTDPHVALRSASRTAGRSGLRNALMAAEVCLALVVLIAAGLFFRSFRESRELDPGFRREGVLLAAYDLTAKNPNPPTSREFARRLLDRLRSLPAVESAAIAVSVPLDIHGLPLRSFVLEGRARSGAAPDRVLSNTVSPDYFKTMGIPFVDGTDFASLGDVGSPPQVVVNQEFVRRFIGDAEPLGRHLESRSTRYAIVGVVRNSLSDSFGEPPTPVIYFSYRDRPAATGEIHLRTRAGGEALLAREVERVVRELDQTLPVYDVRTLSEHVEKNLFLRRIPARMFVFLGPLLLVLAAIGIYAVVAYTVSTRTTEIGVRLALGGTSRRVVSEIVADSLRMVCAGAMVGWLIAFVISLHLIKGPISLSVFAGVPAILLLVATAACWLPAKRAADVDPMVALRQE
jgi:predicted permease